MIFAWIIILIVVVFGFVVFFGAPYIPSHKKQVNRALTELYHLEPTDVLVDVGSGDGVVLRVAARYGAKAVGYEINPILVIISRLLARPFGKKIEIHLADFWRAPLPDATTVVYAFSVSRDTAKMTKKLQTEANRLGRPLSLIMYGISLPGREPLHRVGAHALYTFSPLQ